MKNIFATVAALTILSSSVAAQEGLEIYGFASFAGGQTLNEEELPDGTKTIFGPSDRVIYTEEFEYRPESTVGIQIDADLDDGLKVKTLLQADGAQDYESELRWAYAEYEIAKNLNVSVGRQPLPLFYYTDFIDVGYSYQWVRAPLETYYIKNSTFNGTQITYEPSVGEFEYRFQAYHGRDEDDSASTLTLNDISGFVAYVRKDWFEARATWMEAKIKTQEFGFDPGTGQMVIIGDVETDTNYYGAAIKASWKNGYLTGEWVSDREKDPIQQFSYLEGTDAWYVSTGYGIDNVVPYVTYAESKNHYSDSSPLLLEDAYVKSTSLTAGIRYDFHSNAAVKIEYTSRKDESSDAIVALAGPVKEVDAVSAAIDLVF